MIFPHNLLDKQRLFLSIAEIEQLLPAIGSARLAQCQVVHRKYGLGRISEVVDFLGIHFPDSKDDEHSRRFEGVKKEYFLFLGVESGLYEQLRDAAGKPLGIRSPEAVAAVVQIIELIREEQLEQARATLGAQSLLPLESDLLLRQIKRAEAVQREKGVLDALAAFHFVEADALQQKHKPFQEQEYLDKKAEQVRRAFTPAQVLSHEQAQAIAADGGATLLKARAGSGKTRVLAAKTRYLTEYYGIDPDHILVMAFNKKAASEIQQRIQSTWGVPNFDNARTFHSFAYRLVPPNKAILVEDGNEEADLIKQIKCIFKDILDAKLYEQLYLFFRRELCALETSQVSSRGTDYYIYHRNYRDESLGGERVKSKGEKYIADFLFEHDLQYRYEPVEFWKGSLYRPDFALMPPSFPRTYFIEHWAVDPLNPQSTLPDWWSKTREDYCIEIRDKRKYCQTKQVKLIETSVADLAQGREAFEQLLKEKFEAQGIRCQKLPYEELQKRVVTRCKNRLIRLFTQFIQKAKKRGWTPADVQDQMRGYNTIDRRESFFLDAAYRVYEAYSKQLAVRGQRDFDDLLSEAAQIIRFSKGDCRVRLGEHEQREVAVNRLRWLLLDEYQDLSYLFYDLIRAIRKVNPRIRLMAVGDDWQAINGFAGSDLRFMNDFEHMFPGAETHHLLTNYRSASKIIESGNSLMAELGEPGRYLPEKKGGQVCQIRVDEIFLERREGEKYVKEKRFDNQFIFYRQTKKGRKINDNGLLQARYLKACYEIITDTENWQQIAAVRDQKGKLGVAIVSRTNYLYRIRLADFRDKLRSLFTEKEDRMIGGVTNKIRIGTVHSFKGLEAEIVIVLRATQGTFPLLHPDNALFRLFGETEATTLAAERRLFYVALTRATSQTYLLTETDQESNYLVELEQQNLLTTKSLQK